MITKRIRLERDSDYQYDIDGCAKIAYRETAREGYGTEGVTQEGMRDIEAGIASGALVGLPVYVYSHSGATMSTRPFSCPWDSGQSGFVYMPATEADAYASRDAALDACRAVVAVYDQYLRGDIWGFIAEELPPLIAENVAAGELDADCVHKSDWEHVDSCWGFFGSDPWQNGMVDHVSHLLEEGYVFVDSDGDAITPPKSAKLATA